MRVPQIIKNLLPSTQKLAAPNVKQPRRGNALSFLLQENRARGQKDIDKWRKALNAAERSTMPRRYLLEDVYREVWLDAHLRGEINLRKNKVLQSRFGVYDADGKVDEQKTWLLKQPWFNDLMGYLLDARFYGHSLVQIDGVAPLKNFKGGVQGVTLVPRAHVSPQDGLLLKRPTDPKGILYREVPEFKDWIIETPERNDVGLLNPAAPHALFKRFAQSSWSEFAELFGMPIRVGKTNVRDTEMVRQMEDMLLRMGSSAFAVIDDQEELEFIETARSDGQVFDKLMARCNNEMSKLIMGAVIGGESNGGSRSKEEVGERGLESTVESDKEWLQGIVNTTVFPVLIAHGYPFDGSSFAYEEQKNIKELWSMTHQSLQYYEVDEDWVRETFGIEVTGKRETPAAPPNGNGQSAQQSFFA